MKREVKSGVPNITTLFAPTRLRPVPPARVLIRKIQTFGSLWNLSILGIPERLEGCVRIVTDVNTHDRSARYFRQDVQSPNLEIRKSMKAHLHGSIARTHYLLGRGTAESRATLQIW